MKKTKYLAEKKQSTAFKSKVSESKIYNNLLWWSESSQPCATETVWYARALYKMVVRNILGEKSVMITILSNRNEPQSTHQTSLSCLHFTMSKTWIVNCFHDIPERLFWTTLPHDNIQNLFHMTTPHQGGCPQPAFHRMSIRTTLATHYLFII